MRAEVNGDREREVDVGMDMGENVRISVGKAWTSHSK